MVYSLKHILQYGKIVSYVWNVVLVNVKISNKYGLRNEHSEHVWNNLNLAHILMFFPSLCGDNLSNYLVEL